jgi:hypothetical protein
MFAIDTGFSDRTIGMMEGAALDAVYPETDRAIVLAKLSELLLLKMNRLRSMEGKRRNFWTNADLIREMSDVAPAAHDALIEHLFWASQPQDAIDAYCDAHSEMPPVD